MGQQCIKRELGLNNEIWDKHQSNKDLIIYLKQYQDKLATQQEKNISSSYIDQKQQLREQARILESQKQQDVIVTENSEDQNYNEESLQKIEEEEQESSIIEIEHSGYDESQVESEQKQSEKEELSEKVAAKEIKQDQEEELAQGGLNIFFSINKAQQFKEKRKKKIKRKVHRYFLIFYQKQSEILSNEDLEEPDDDLEEFKVFQNTKFQKLNDSQTSYQIIFSGSNSEEDDDNYLDLKQNIKEV